MKLYGVVTMDIVRSKKIAQREQFQNELINYIENVNQKHSNILVSPISITSGDEWQLITRNPSECYNLIHQFQQFLWIDQIDFYAGIGIGGISTSEYSDIRKMDGPCFHLARAALNIAKNQAKTKNKYIFSKHNKIFFESDEKNLLNRIDMHFNNKIRGYWDEVASGLGGGNFRKITLGTLINVIIENNEILKARMTPKQKKIYIEYLETSSYRKIIEKYGKESKETIGGISQKLNNAEYFTIQRNNEMVKNLLDFYCMLGSFV